MEKTEMMKRYEEETGRHSVRGITDGIHNVWFDIWHYQYLQWLEAKAEAYDRLMSGGKKTLKEWANLFGMVVAVDRDGATWAYPYLPIRDGAIWRSDGKNWSLGAVDIPNHLVDFDGDWKDSLTLPDGWEDK